MGCDIHCYIEYRSKDPNKNFIGSDGWSSFGKEIYPGRDYQLFEQIAGVRGELKNAVFEPRGVPQDLGYSAQEDYWLYVHGKNYKGEPEDGWVTQEKAATWIQSYGCEHVLSIDGTQINKVSNPDYHSHSWLTTDEYQEVLNQLNPKGRHQYHAMLAAMRSLEAQGFNARLVFWFDN